MENSKHLHQISYSCIVNVILIHVHTNSNYLLSFIKKINMIQYGLISFLYK